ncbi:hypothetical protein M409DRAFT_19121 [Zasmidium cellare ATCC 36951]|uniref:Uncharacterized protein n=1 Tax=Zasmidium cellare ATCC 36951 TaxID=1080233 RepID=A0A6A6CY82_ZASCE|nr:uncharacterized protein M409DRAFT_19121 [Zasmidium cellare ATCC 36951]KAF2171150.1 hypothetical protein M409DRAFT_19121 [Zasmidium cellare ATCC 36951]
MPIRSVPRVLQALRSYSTTARAVNQDRLGAATAVAYWCAVVSAPFAGAYAISQAAGKDSRSTTWRQLSFRDCLPSSSLDDYAGAYLRLRR